MATTKFMGGEVMTKICVALGLTPNLVHRVILDVSCDDIAKVYVEGYATKEAFEVDLSAALRGAIVITAATGEVEEDD